MITLLVTQYLYMYYAFNMPSIVQVVTITMAHLV